MKKDNPGELSVDTDVTEPCEISEQQLRETVEGVLNSIQYYVDRIRRVTGMVGVASERRLSGNIDVCDQCGFRRRDRSRLGYGSFGAHDGDSEVVLSSVTRQVERAIVDYLIANFDP